MHRVYACCAVTALPASASGQNTVYLFTPERLCTLNQESLQKTVAAFTDAEQLLFTSGGVFAANQPLPRWWPNCSSRWNATGKWGCR